jgi:hypothetical protein
LARVLVTLRAYEIRSSVACHEPAFVVPPPHACGQALLFTEALAPRLHLETLVGYILPPPAFPQSGPSLRTLYFLVQLSYSMAPLGLRVGRTGLRFLVVVDRRTSLSLQRDLDQMPGAKRAHKNHPQVGIETNADHPEPNPDQTQWGVQ